MASDRVDELERRLEDLERKPSVRDRGRSVLELLVPAETRRHLRNAGRENLLAVRSLLDFWIDEMLDKDAEPAAGPEKIKIE